MKPVKKTSRKQSFKPYGTAKPYLMAELGAHCSYCERRGAPQDLHVEHIYPKDPHPDLEHVWDNFLISCNTCNSYKNICLGSAKQQNLETRFIWPHLENTFIAFSYKSTGEVDVSNTVPAALKPAVEATRDMVGLLLSPQSAETYQKLGIAYDGANKRSQMWNMASQFRTMYLANPTQDHARTVATGANQMGHFSIWMEVFHDRPEVRRELIRSFKADPACFDAQTRPLPKGRL